MKYIYLLILSVISHSLVFGQEPDGFEPGRIDEQGKARADQLAGPKIDSGTSHYVNDGSSNFASGSLFNTIDLSSYELLSGNLSFTDKDQTQKVVFAPLRLIPNLGPSWLGNTKINLALKDKITTIGIAFGGDNSTYNSNRGHRLLRKVFPNHTIPAPPAPADISLPATFDDFVFNVLSQPCDGAPAKCNQDLLDSLKVKYASLLLQRQTEAYFRDVVDPYAAETIDELLLEYDLLRIKSVFKWSVGYNIQLFPNLFTQGEVNGFDTVNYYNLKAHTISGTVSYGYNHKRIHFNIGVGYNQIFMKNTAVKGQETVPYYGPSASASTRLFKFLSDRELKKNENYKKSLFVPCISLGLTWEAKFADGAMKYQAFYPDNIKNTITWTPFVDILISPALQFRIGLPINRFEYLSGEKITAAGANIQYNFKLSNLAQ